MSKFVTDKSFWELFPDAEIGIVVLKGIDNSDSVYEKYGDEIRGDLKKANKEANKFFTNEQLSLCPVVAVWRDAFQKFKKKKDNRSSIEALLKRVQKGNEVGSINPLVDIYNTSSLNFGLPCGGEDLDTFVGDLRLTITNGGDDFYALGEGDNDPTLPGELCYLDDKGAVCRCWNWRDGQRTMLQGNTKNAFMIFESVDPTRHDDLVKAMDTLADTAHKYLGAEVAVKKVINNKDREVEL
jgi:DNA/RNA-binding domain of Phe-tRNA-synthetase-like protein